MNIVQQITLFSLLFIIALCDKIYYKQEQINQIDSLSDTWSTIVSIRYDCRHNNYIDTHCCTGTILSGSYILTAAHCVDSLSRNITISHKWEQIIPKIDQIHIHPKWNDLHRNGKYDIALLHLSNPFDVTVNKQVTRIRIPTRFYQLNDTLLTIVDWDQNVRVLWIDNSDPICNSLIDDSEQQFCVRFSEKTQGDRTGQPILQWIKNRWMQIGIVGFITKYVDNSYIGVVNSLHYYYDWLESIVNTHHLKKFNIEKMVHLVKDLPTTYQCYVHKLSCGCSENNVQLSSTRIVGGEEAVPYSWSMVVSIHLDGSDEPSCTGSILTRSYILTSAHCVDIASEIDMYIVAGVHNRFEDFPIVRYVQKIYIHPEWNKNDGTYRNDIALLRIFPPLLITNNGHPALTCVPYINPVSETINYPSEGDHLVMVGWGSTQYNSHIISNTLQQVSVDVIDKNDPKCLQTIHDVNKQFCATKSGRGPCHGDEGGPIFQWRGTYWDQVGIISYGGQCEQAGAPGISTRLSRYFDWMESIVDSSLTTTTPAPPTPPPEPVLHECNRALTCGCGKTDVSIVPSRIVGGDDVLDDSWPMIVSLRLHGSTHHSCGGTILSKSFVLTAAHCLDNISDINPSGLTIAAGMTNLSDPQKIIRNVDRIYFHPYYLGETNDKRHDIALLHVDQPFVFESDLQLTKTCIRRIDPSIPIDQYPKNGTRLVVIGWGLLQPGTDILPEILQQVQVFAIDNENSRCQTSIQDTELQFCAGLYQGGKDSCQGDSGGPIFQWTGDYWEQVGIVSYGLGCAIAIFPGIYTRLSYYYDWIQNILIRNGEYLESGTLSSTTMITSNTPIDSSTITSYRSFSTTLYSAYKYQFNIMIYGLLLLSFFSTNFLRT